VIWTIAKKELLVHIKSMRFGIALVLCSSVIALSAYVSGLDYAKRLSAYNSAVERHRQALRQVKVYSYLRPVVDLPPAPLSIFSRGGGEEPPEFDNPIARPHSYRSFG